MPADGNAFRTRLNGTSLIRDCIFDLGGVVVDWNPRNLYRKMFQDEAAMEAFLEEIGFGEWNMEQDRGRSFQEGVRLLSSRYPHHAELIAAYDQRWEESIPGPIVGTLELLQELRGAGYALHALTNWSAEKFTVAERRFDFATWFDQVVVSGREGICKPDPAIFHILLDRIGRSATDCLFVDDSEANVRAAERLGLTAILFLSPEQLSDELRQLGILRAPTGAEPSAGTCVTGSVPERRTGQSHLQNTSFFL